MQDISVILLSLTERTPIVIQLCLRSQIGLWGTYYYSLFHITHYFSSDVRFTKFDIVVLSMGQTGGDVKDGVQLFITMWTIQKDGIYITGKHGEYDDVLGRAIIKLARSFGLSVFVLLVKPLPKETPPPNSQCYSSKCCQWSRLLPPHDIISSCWDVRFVWQKQTSILSIIW